MECTVECALVQLRYLPDSSLKVCASCSDLLCARDAPVSASVRCRQAEDKRLCRIAACLTS